MVRLRKKEYMTRKIRSEARHGLYLEDSQEGKGYPTYNKKKED
jgi:hypothetical protein